MSTNISSASAIGNTGALEGLSPENRQKLSELAAEFESMLLNQLLRDMNEAGKWSKLGENGLDTLGAETFDQTFQQELSRYIAKAGGLGLSQQLMKALDAVAGNAGTTSTASAAATTSWPSPTVSAAPIATTSGRIGWNGLQLDPPAYGGSGAQWNGFNTDRAMAGGNPAGVKDAFYRWTYGLSYNPAGSTKPEIEQFLKNNLDSARAYGLNILDVQNEKILVETKENGPEWVDVVFAVNSKDPSEVAWQWLPVEEGPATGGGPLGEAFTELRGLPQGDAIASSLMKSSGLSGEALLAAIQAELSAARTGAASPTLTSASVSAQSASSNPQSAIPTAIWPATDLSLPASTVTSAYGWRQDPFTGEAKFHKGVDFRAPEGSEVSSAGAGRVTFAGTSAGYGTTVIVEHANGLSTRYAHLSEALVKVGDQVADRQVVGRAGQTGRATSAHLHFEVLEDGVPVDPFR